MAMTVLASAIGRLLAGGCRRAGFAAAVGMAILPLSWPSAVGADQDTRPDLTVTDYDTVFYRDKPSDYGTIDMVNPDNSLNFTLIDNSHHLIAAGSYLRIVTRRPASKAIKECGKWDLTHNDPDDVIKVVLWGYKTYPAKTKDEALAAASKEAAFNLATKAMAAWPDNTDLASKAVLPLLQDKGDTKSIEELARRLVKVDPHWTEGYDYVAKVMEADPARSDELMTWLTDWLKFQPTAFRPNHFLARLHEKAGNLRQAQEEFRKCYVMHKDLDSGLGYARTSLARGDAEKALAAATELFSSDGQADEAKAVAGSAKLILNDLPGAQSLLDESLKGKLSDDSAKMAHYNLGVVSFRSGKPDDARAQWTPLDLPVAKFALAVLDRRAFAELDTLPTDGLKELAKLLNACVDLEHGKSGAAVALDARLSARHLYLSELAKLVLSGGTNADAIVHDLSSTPGLESQRWQIYALLLGKKYKEVEAALSQLPEEDPYGLAYRVCAAQGLGKPDQAKIWFQKLIKNPGAPQPWTNIIGSVFQASNDTVLDEKFNWQGDNPNDGWLFSTPGTGIRIHSDGTQLLLEGTQSANPEPVSRAWVVVQENRFRQVKLDIDLTGMATATAGLEITDADHKTGVELAVRSDSHLAYRVATSGMWAAWQPLALQIQGTHATLCIDYNNGRTLAFMPDEPLTKYPLSAFTTPPPEQLCIGIFGLSDPGVMWKVAATHNVIQLKPLTGPGTGVRRLGDP
jgi:tetratricopeptide (TPR) repeat protein